MATANDEIEFIPIPVDRETLSRLVRLARACGRHPVDAAAALLRDLMLDDERTNLSALDVNPSIN